MFSYAFVLKKALLPVYESIKKKNLVANIANYQHHLSLTPEQIQELQWEQLKKLLIHAYKNTSFYPEVWAKAGILHVDDIKTMADFSKLPIITKDDIASHYDELLARNFKNNIKKATGGSTGQPFRFELDIESNTRREAVMWRGYGWLNAGLGEKTLYLWGADIGQPTFLKTVKNNLYHAFYNRKILNSFAMNNDNILEYVEKINNYRPRAIVSYVNPLYELSKFILDNNIKVHSPNSILTGAEPLYDFQRTKIENAFNCQVYNTFGCREFMLISAECQQFKNLHMNSDHLVIETVNEVGQPISEASGDLVITDLYNYGMPLIRYLNGDRATLVKEQCKCGNPLPIMKSIDGRRLDIIKTPSGKKIPGELFPHLFKEFPSIIKFQVKQTHIESLDILIIAKNNELPKDELSKIKAELNRYAENELLINIKFVQNIPLTISGKHKVTICEV